MALLVLKEHWSSIVSVFLHLLNREFKPIPKFSAYFADACSLYEVFCAQHFRVSHRLRLNLSMSTLNYKIF